MSKSLLEAFNIKSKPLNHTSIDYNVFKDKELLEEFRIKI